MSTTRRRIIRPEQSQQPSIAQVNRKRQQIQAKVDKANATIERWWKRLNRATNVIHKHQKQLARLQRQLRDLASGGA